MKLRVTHQWNGVESKNKAWFEVEAGWTEAGMELKFVLPKEFFVKVPDAPPGYVDGLWEYDVAEIFFGFVDGSYLEFEIDRAGHWLLLDFKEIRVRNREYDDIELRVETTELDQLVTHRIFLPREVVKERPATVNACACVGDEFLSHAKMPGDEADFHQPSQFVDF